MQIFRETENAKYRCADCGDIFAKNAGRYIFDGNAYCPACWKSGDTRMNLIRGSYGYCRILEEMISDDIEGALKFTQSSA